MARNVVQQLGGGEAPEGTIALGRISVTSQVTMSFRLEWTATVARFGPAGCNKCTPAKC